MKIVCIGMNYVDHLAEMSSDMPNAPIFFIKPDSALLRDNDPFFIPDFSKDLQYECEFVVKIAKVAKSVDVKFANRYYNEVGLGIDFTARDIQRECKAKGLPWEIAKGFDYSAAVPSLWIEKERLGELAEVEFELEVNGEMRQKTKLNRMIFGVDQIVSYVSRFVTLKVGDLVFTGTPAGVGRVEVGDRLVARMRGGGEECEILNFEIK